MRRELSQTPLVTRLQETGRVRVVTKRVVHGEPCFRERTSATHAFIESAERKISRRFCLRRRKSRWCQSLCVTGATSRPGAPDSLVRNETRGPVPNPHVLPRAPVFNARNSLTLWFLTRFWLTGRFTKGARGHPFRTDSMGVNSDAIRAGWSVSKNGRLPGSRKND